MRKSPVTVKRVLSELGITDVSDNDLGQSAQSIYASEASGEVVWLTKKHVWTGSAVQRILFKKDKEQTEKVRKKITRAVRKARFKHHPDKNKTQDSNRIQIINKRGDALVKPPVERGVIYEIDRQNWQLINTLCRYTPQMSLELFTSEMNVFVQRMKMFMTSWKRKAIGPNKKLKKYQQVSARWTEALIAGISVLFHTNFQLQYDTARSNLPREVCIQVVNFFAQPARFKVRKLFERKLLPILRDTVPSTTDGARILRWISAMRQLTALYPNNKATFNELYKPFSDTVLQMN